MNIWFPDEIRKLRRMWEAGERRGLIAFALNMTVSSVMVKVREMEDLNDRKRRWNKQRRKRQHQRRTLNARYSQFVEMGGVTIRRHPSVFSDPKFWT